MNAYQKKWIEMLTNAHIRGWRIEPRDNDIFIEMPHVTDIKLTRDNIPATIGVMSLDIHEKKERLKFIFHNGFEQFEYLINPSEDDLTKR